MTTPGGETVRRLRDLLACPTAPYRETAVHAWVTTRLDAAGVAHCDDPDGNLIVGAGSLNDYRARLARRGGGPLAVLIAHMDHPGFHGMRWLAPDRLAVRWHGGGPVRHLRGARVWLTADGLDELSGRLQRPVLTPGGRGLAQAEVRLDQAILQRRPGARRLYGGLAFRAPTWRSGNRLYTRVADDLTGVFAIVETACRIQGRRVEPEFIGLLTRAEEVGFVGMLTHLEAGWLQRARRPLLCISLEASRHGPGAALGHGPVVRFGDRQGPFSPDCSRLLDQLASTTLAGRYQRKLMDGGSCEATAMLAYGLPATGLALPLGNYHNQNLDGGQDASAPGGPAPEFVDLRDISGLLELCHALATRSWPDDPWTTVRQRLSRRLRSDRSRLAAR